MAVVAHWFEKGEKAHVLSMENDRYELLEWARHNGIPENWLQRSNNGLWHFDVWGWLLEYVRPLQVVFKERVREIAKKHGHRDEAR